VQLNLYPKRVSRQKTPDQEKPRQTTATMSERPPPRFLSVSGKPLPALQSASSLHGRTLLHLPPVYHQNELTHSPCAQVNAATSPTSTNSTGWARAPTAWSTAPSTAERTTSSPSSRCASSTRIAATASLSPRCARSRFSRAVFLAYGKGRVFPEARAGIQPAPCVGGMGGFAFFVSRFL